MIVDVFVPGVPRPQGSLSTGRNGQMYYSNAAVLKPWRKDIEMGVRAFMPRNHTPIDNGVRVEVHFYFERPKIASERLQKTTAPDLDKLQRAVGDALTSTDIYTDDSRIIEWVATKHYVDDLHVDSGVYIKVYSILNRDAVTVD